MFHRELVFREERDEKVPHDDGGFGCCGRAGSPVLAAVEFKYGGQFRNRITGSTNIYDAATKAVTTSTSSTSVESLLHLPGE